MPERMSTPEQPYDLAIIGGGQAGLATAYWAKQRGLDYQLFEANTSIGESWRNRYDSLELFTPRAYSSLPAMPMRGDQNGYPTKDEVADYLEEYAAQNELTVKLGEPVTELRKTSDLFQIATPRGTYQSKAAVVATGPFQTPRTPDWHDQLAVQQMHSADYRNPDQITGHKVLVVGGGNSGAQIAEELAKQHDVTMAVAGTMRFMRAKILGQGLFTWLDKTGLLNAPTGSIGANILRKRGDPIIGTSLKSLIAEGKVTVKPVAESGTGDTIRFADATSGTFDSVIWCTGYTLEYPWLNIPKALDERGQPKQIGGIAVDVERLCFMGLGWMRSRNSALIGGVGRDAECVTAVLARKLKQP